MSNVISFDVKSKRTICETEKEEETNQIPKRFDLKSLFEYTGIKYQLWYKIIVLKNEIPYYKIGSKVIVNKSDIDEYFNAHFVSVSTTK